MKPKLTFWVGYLRSSPYSLEGESLLFENGIGAGYGLYDGEAEIVNEELKFYEIQPDDLLLISTKKLKIPDVKKRITQFLTKS